MKVQGASIQPPEDKVIVIPRNGTNLVFKAKAVLDFSDFDRMCPTPVPPTVTEKGGAKHKNTEHPKYIAAIAEWSAKKTAWTILMSLSATEGLEWETVKMSDPETWTNYQNELEENFSALEQNKIVSMVMEACSLTADHIEEATKRFLSGDLPEVNEESSQEGEATSTQSSEPVKGSD